MQRHTETCNLRLTHKLRDTHTERHTLRVIERKTHRDTQIEPQARQALHDRI